MELKVISTGSAGNSYLLENESEALLIEAGVNFKKVKETIGHRNLHKIAGCLLTHSHLDHSGSMHEVMRHGINTYSLQETFDSRRTGVKSHREKAIKPFQPFDVGGFRIKAFDVVHDVPTVGFLIWHKDTGLVLFMTDSQYSPYSFPGLNNIIIEANYSHEEIRQRLWKKEFLKNRVMDSHMSLDTCIKFLKANDLSAVNNIVLVHLSDGNSNEKLFKSEVEKATGKTVTVADNGLVIEINKTPF